MSGLNSRTGNELQKIDIKNWVTKSNDLIESTYKLSLQEQRILLVMASKVQPSDETLKTYSFAARDFIEIIGNKKGTGFYSHLKEIVKGLQTKVLTIRKDGQERDYSWVITSIYEANEGYITLQFHPDLKDLFLELKEKFTTYQLENVVRLNSVYSIRIYELLKQYEKIKKRQLTMADLRSLLGIEQNKYKQYGHFKNKVLLVAQNEINQKTDIRFEFNEIKTVRKVTSIEFIITSNKKAIRQIDTDSTDSSLSDHRTSNEKDRTDTDKDEIRQIALEIGIKLTDKVINQWLSHPKENILKLLETVRYKDDIANPIGYITTVLSRQADAEGAVNSTSTNEHIDPIQNAIDNIVKKYRPKNKVAKIDSLPEFIIKETSVEEFMKIMEQDAAEYTWRQHKETILTEVNKQRRSMQYS